METAKVEVRSRERVQIRTRESAVTLSAWRVELESPRGAIVLAEGPAGKSFYRGEGALLGKSQAELAQVWQATLPEVPPEQEPLQLG